MLKLVTIASNRLLYFNVWDILRNLLNMFWKYIYIIGITQQVIIVIVK